MFSKATLQGDINNVDAVLQVGVVENKDLISKLRGDSEMCEALRELMKDDIEQIVKDLQSSAGRMKQSPRI